METGPRLYCILITLSIAVTVFFSTTHEGCAALLAASLLGFLELLFETEPQVASPSREQRFSARSRLEAS